MSCRTIVCDIQGFRGFNNDFIVKEVAFLTTSGSMAQSIVFKPPYPHSILPDTQQKVATWVKNFCHGMDWDDGYTPYDELSNVFNKILEPYNAILVKGSEKKTFIENILHGKNVSVRNMDDILCPRIDDLRKQTSFQKCFYHSKIADQCASENVRLLLNWYVNTFMKKSIFFETEERIINDVGEIIEKLNTPNEFGIRSLANLKISEICCLPKEYFKHHVSYSDLLNVWDLLPTHTRNKLRDIIYCNEHCDSYTEDSDHMNGKLLRRINCTKCKQMN